MGRVVGPLEADDIAPAIHAGDLDPDGFRAHDLVLLDRLVRPGIRGHDQPGGQEKPLTSHRRPSLRRPRRPRNRTLCRSGESNIPGRGPGGRSPEIRGLRPLSDVGRDGFTSRVADRRQPLREQAGEEGIPSLIQGRGVGQGGERQRLVDGTVVGFEREDAGEVGLVAVLALPEGGEGVVVGIGGEPLERLGPERQDAVALPVHGEQLGQEGAEPLLDRRGVRLVPRRLERDRVGQERVLERPLDPSVRLRRRFAVPRLVQAGADEPSPGADQGLAGRDLVLAQVAREDADRGVERPGVQDRPRRVLVRSLIDRRVDGEFRAHRLAVYGLDQGVDRTCHGEPFSAVLMPAPCPRRTDTGRRALGMRGRGEWHRGRSAADTTLLRTPIGLRRERIRGPSPER